MDPIALLATALAGAFSQVGAKLLEEGIVDPALEPATELLKKWLQRPYRRAEEDKALQDAVRAALEEAGVPTDDPDELIGWLKRVGLDQLQAERNDELRRQVAMGVLACTDPEADPPESLMTALGWPRSRKKELAALLSALRAQLFRLDDWRPPIEYANEAAKLGLLRDILSRLSLLDTLILPTDAGATLRVAVVQAGLTEEEAAEIEARYRQEVARDLYWHDFRGIVQVKQDMRLPLADIYVELGLLPLEDDGAADPAGSSPGPFLCRGGRAVGGDQGGQPALFAGRTRRGGLSLAP